MACDRKLVRGLRRQHSRGVSLGDVADRDARDLFHRLDVHGRDVVRDRHGHIGRFAVRRQRDPGGALPTQVGAPDHFQIRQRVSEQFVVLPAADDQRFLVWRDGHAVRRIGAGGNL